jgi:hypothetical protein
MCNCGSNTQPREVWTSAQAQAEHERQLADQAAQNQASAEAAMANAGGGQ